jgi:hypothetical protein
LWKVSKCSSSVRKAGQALKLLRAEEQLVVDVVEPLHDPIAPRFPWRNKDDLHLQIQTEPDEQSETMRITVRASKR